MYRVRFVKRIRTEIGHYNDVLLYHDIMLSFIPFPGLRVKDGNVWEDRVEEVCYRTTNGYFYMETEPDTEILKAKQRGDTVPSIEEIVVEYIEAGWLRAKGDRVF